MSFPRVVSLLAFSLGLTAAVAAAAGDAFQYRNPVRAGDYPDPSVIRVGDDYWAAATSSEWAPHFPILHSRDLVNWEIKGYVFGQMPDWAKANFWAPEISAYQGKFFVYYAARQAASNRLAVAVATAEQPAGPYTDHGPLVVDEAGSIDPMAFTDAHGARWLVWKEDGNSQKRLTPIWLQRLREDGLALTGPRQELLHNDAPWEGAVTEGPFVLRHGDFYYLFYSGNACCGRDCNYALGVARAKDMTGPWEKAPANPILAGNAQWRCPGHGSIVTDPDGRYWLLYHGYAQQGFVATGRQMLLDEVVFGADGWPSINGGHGPSGHADGPRTAIAQQDITLVRDDFDGRGDLAPGWQWILGRKPVFHLGGGRLTLEATEAGAAAVRSIVVPSFVSETAVDATRLTAGAWAGLVVFGDRANLLALVTDGKKIEAWSEQKGRRSRIAEAEAAPGPLVRLRVACDDGRRFRFALQDERGAWREIAGDTDGSFLPPWDRGVRTGVYAVGNAESAADFDYFSATPGSEKLLIPGQDR